MKSLTSATTFDEFLRELLGDTSHGHKCECGNRWEHSDALKFDPACTESKFKDEHTCKECGREVWVKEGY